jgi:membrane-bound inhibitor of C-type lysozyme
VNGVAIGIGNKYKISILGDWTEGDQAQLTLKKPGYIFKNSLTTVLHAFKN